MDVLTKATVRELVLSENVRIDGRDIDPAGAAEPPSLSCRIYHLPDGRVSPIPSREQLEEALA